MNQTNNALFRHTPSHHNVDSSQEFLDEELKQVEEDQQKSENELWDIGLNHEDLAIQNFDNSSAR